MDIWQIERRVAELHQGLGLDLSRPVDVFESVRREGIFLAFRPLKIFGAYVNPTGMTPGILINSNHPLQLQRFTAGHELGHFALGHEPTADTNVGGYMSGQVLPVLKQERDADLFAALFLMPLELVRRAITGMGVEWGTVNVITRTQMLMLSTYLGTSYTAATYRLRALGLIDDLYRDRLLKVKPTQIKEELGGFKPTSIRRETGLTWNDVVVWNATSLDGTILLQEQQVFQIALYSSTSGGYMWEPPVMPEGVHLEITPKPIVPEDVYGGGIRHVFTIAGLRPGTWTLRFVERRLWETGPGRQEVLVKLQVEPKRLGISQEQLLSAQGGQNARGAQYRHEVPWLPYVTKAVEGRVLRSRPRLDTRVNRAGLSTYQRNTSIGCAKGLMIGQWRRGLHLLRL